MNCKPCRVTCSIDDAYLREITNRKFNFSQTSRFEYVQDDEGRLTQWTRWFDGSLVAEPQVPVYDDADRLKQLTRQTSTGGRQWKYTYDDAGNRGSETVVDTPGGITFQQGYTVNLLDQLTYADSTSPTGMDNDFDWDANGNMTNAQAIFPGLGVIDLNYEWDIKNQLVAYEVPGQSRSEFTYDGLGRRVRIVEKNGAGTVIADRYFVWDGLTIAEERATPGGSPVKMFYPQGEVRPGLGEFYYTRDHLGSVREIVDQNDNLIARYDYDPFGKPVQTYGTAQCDFMFTGHFHHWPSGLVLAPYRAYNPSFGRWISRDPIGVDGGLNLYGYVGGDPLKHIDSLGLAENGEYEINGSPIGNFLTATGDVMSFGLGGVVREQFQSLDVVVDEDAPSYALGEFTGGAVSTAATLVVRAGTVGVQVVTHFAPEGVPAVLESGRWVMTGAGRGIDGLRNYLFSGLAGKFKNSITIPVSKDCLKWPSGWEKIKGILGQRIYTGPPVGPIK